MKFHADSPADCVGLPPLRPGRGDSLVAGATPRTDDLFRSVNTA